MTKETKRNIVKAAKVVLAILTFPLHVLIMGTAIWAHFFKKIMTE